MTRRSGDAGPAQRGPSQRQLRVGEELRHALAALIERGEMRDPELRGVPVTVTMVDVSPDLRSAVAFVVPLGGSDAPRILAALRRAAPWFRGRLADAVRLRYAPELRFALDSSFDHAARIDALLRDPVVAQDLDGETADRARPADDDAPSESR